MAQDGQDAGTFEIARQLFDLAAAVYRADPTDASLTAAFESKPTPDDHARLTEVVQEVGRAQGFPPRLLGHLARALVVEGRLMEAAHVCKKWIALDPDSFDAHCLAACIAIKRFDIDTAREAYKRLREFGKLQGTLDALEAAFSLAFSDSPDAAVVARRALASFPRDPMAPLVAHEAAYRHRDGQLLLEAFEAEPSLADVPIREGQARALLIGSLLVSLLQQRMAQKETL
jgi:tetratricopeptide (TPR) repeat protein